MLACVLLFLFLVTAAAAYTQDHREQDQNLQNTDHTVHYVFKPVSYVICICQVRVKKYHELTIKTLYINLCLHFCLENDPPVIFFVVGGAKL